MKLHLNLKKTSYNTDKMDEEDSFWKTISQSWRISKKDLDNN